MSRACASVTSVLAIFVGLAALPARAAHGLVYDKVSFSWTDRTPNFSPPGSFARDLADVQRPFESEDDESGFALLFSKIRNMRLFENDGGGLGSREYFGGDRFREDSTFYGIAKITNCRDEEWTTLNVRAKVAVRMTFDAFSSNVRHPKRALPQYQITLSPPKDSSPMVVVARIDRIASSPIGGLRADGFEADIDVERSLANRTRSRAHIAYRVFYADRAVPSRGCLDSAPAEYMDNRGERVAALVARVFAALDSPHPPHARVDRRGPRLPTHRLALWESMQYGDDLGPSYAEETEIGNLRALDGDPSPFEVPSDYKRVGF